MRAHSRDDGKLLPAEAGVSPGTPALAGSTQQNQFPTACECARPMNADHLSVAQTFLSAVSQAFQPADRSKAPWPAASHSPPKPRSHPHFLGWPASFRKAKSEGRNPNLDTIINFKGEMFQTPMPRNLWRILDSDFLSFLIRICFGFRISDFGFEPRRAFCLLAFAALLLPFDSLAEDPIIVPARPSSTTTTTTNAVSLIDLPTALRLAGAQNLDIQIARQRLAKARANQESSVWQFFPAITPGVSYRRHDNLIQDVGGSIIPVHKEAYAVGPSLGGQLELGDAIYRNLASRQLTKAADYALESERQTAIVAAAQGYFDLVKARSSVGVAREAVGISTNYSAQVEQAVGVGIAFKGDFLRVQVQSERDRLILRQAQEQQRVAAARLAQSLHLDSMVELVPSDNEAVPLSLFATNASLDSLVAQALGSRPELHESRALTEAARQAKKGARYGPIIPSVGAQVFVGGLEGGKDGSPGTFGESEDYLLTLGWRIGPGGLFDRGRIRAAESRYQIADLSRVKLLDEITREVIESQTRVQSQADQMDTARRAIQAAQETLRLTQARKEFAVGVVLEAIQAEQDLTRVRLDYLNALAEYNKAQYALQRAIGGLSSTASSTVAKPKEQP